MKKISSISRAAFIVSASFGINKLVAIVRQLIIARQFGLSADLDVFNVANNIPDMLYALISGGALAVAIIPVLTEVMTKKDRRAAWRVFSHVANIAFLITLTLSLLVAIFAWPLVQHPLGIAPGFNLEQQTLVVKLMRLDLVATIIFSMAGLLIAGLQANQHFLLPAIGPIVYNIGQIFGAVVLSPAGSYQFGTFKLPAFNLGIDGLVYGVLIGSAAYFLLQIPGLVKYEFKWTPGVNFRDPEVRKILRMLGPRVLSMFLYQLTFIARDNIASRLPLGSVTALTYGWMIQQVPETLIGTALGTALLPSMSEKIARSDRDGFGEIIARASRVLIALAIPATLLTAVALQPFLAFAFGFDTESTAILMWVTRAFLLGLVGHVFLEIGARIYFAQQNASIPLVGAGINLILYVIAGWFLSKPFQAVGVGLADAIAFSGQAAFLMGMYWNANRKNTRPEKNRLAAGKRVPGTILRTSIGSVLGSGVIWVIIYQINLPLPELLTGIVAFLCGLLITIPFILPELKALFDL